jgi:hypothetical protein
VTFVGPGVDPSSGATRLMTATRQPDGQVTAPRPLPVPPSAFDVHVASAPNGRALLVWRAGNLLHTVERPPGGDFGDESDIPSPPSEAGLIDQVTIASSGAAAITLGAQGQRAVFRDHGGTFFLSKAVLDTGGSRTGLALDEGGDAAVTWHGAYGNGVHAAYRAAGKRAWSPPLTLAPKRPFAPYDENPPALAIDPGGSATVAWEESDGERARTFSSDFRGSTLGPTSLVNSMPTYFAEAPPSACHPPGSRPLLRDRRAIVFSRGGSPFGCLFGRGVPVALGDATFPSNTMALAGPLVASGYNYVDEAGEVSTIEVLDLRDPDDGSGLTRAIAMDRGDYATPLVTKLRANGAVAWISCSGGYLGSPDVKPCRRLGGLIKHVWVWGARREVKRLVDSGRRIDARSFRLRASRLTWRHAGKLRHATLR